MDKKETRKEKREKEYKDSVAIMEEVYSEEYEENEQKQKEMPLEMNEECKEFIESVKQIKTLTMIERPWWFFYIFFWDGLTFMTIIFSIFYEQAINTDKSFKIAIPIFWVTWTIVTIYFIVQITRELRRPTIYFTYQINGINYYFLYVKKGFIFADGTNYIYFINKRSKKIGKSSFKKAQGDTTLDCIVTCKTMKVKRRGNKKIYKGESVIYSAGTKVITDMNNKLIKAVFSVDSHMGGECRLYRKAIGVDDINRKIYVPKQLKPSLKRRGIEFPDIPNMVEIPDELIWKHIKVKDLYN